MRSDGTVPSSAADVIGIRTFLAPLSRQTCRTLASSSTIRIVPLILISPRTARLDSVGLLKAQDVSWTYVNTLDIGPIFLSTHSGG